MRIIKCLCHDKLLQIIDCDTAMSATVNRSRKPRSSKPSYKIMVLTAIASQRKSRRGVSRQRIAAYLQQHYHVSTGGRFNAALRSALNSGIQSGILKFGDTKQRFNLTNEGRKLKKKKTAKSNKRTANETKRKEQKKNERADTNTAGTSPRCNIEFDQKDYASTDDRALLSTVTKGPGKLWPEL